MRSFRSTYTEVKLKLSKPTMQPDCQHRGRGVSRIMLMCQQSNILCTRSLLRGGGGLAGSCCVVAMPEIDPIPHSKL